MSIGWNPSTFDFVTIFVHNDGSFKATFIVFFFFWTIGKFCKRVNVAFKNETSFEIINDEINCNYAIKRSCRPNLYAFLLSKFIGPCDSHFIAYFNN